MFNLSETGPKALCEINRKMDGPFLALYRGRSEWEKLDKPNPTPPADGGLPTPDVPEQVAGVEEVQA